MTKLDIGTLPRTTPSEIAEPTYQAARARRHKPINGIPDRRATWRKTIDGPLLAAFAGKAFAAYLDATVSAEWRQRVADQLLADVDRRYSPADMIVLTRHDLTREFTVLLVDNGGRHLERFPIPPRQLPDGNRRRLFEPHIFVAAAATNANGRAQVPAAAMPLFEAIAEVRRAWPADFETSARWPYLFEREHGRPPKWSEIEQAYPRIGAWMALQRAGR